MLALRDPLTKWWITAASGCVAAHIAQIHDARWIESTKCLVGASGMNLRHVWPITAACERPFGYSTTRVKCTPRIRFDHVFTLPTAGLAHETKSRLGPRRVVAPLNSIVVSSPSLLRLCTRKQNTHTHTLRGLRAPPVFLHLPLIEWLSDTKCVDLQGCGGILHALTRKSFPQKHFD